MRIGVIIFVLGVISFCLGLTLNSMGTITQSTIGASSIFLLLWFGACFWVVGTILLLRGSKRSDKKNYHTPPRAYYKSTIDPRVISFIVTWILAIIFGLISILIVDFFFGTKEPIFYQIAIPGLIIGSFLFSLINNFRTSN